MSSGPARQPMLRLRDPGTGALEPVQRRVVWAGEPAAPTSHPMVDRVVTALDADLDPRAALDVVRAMEPDASIASGAKLETLLCRDRTFGGSTWSPTSPAVVAR